MECIEKLKKAMEDIKVVRDTYDYIATDAHGCYAYTDNPRKNSKIIDEVYHVKDMNYYHISSDKEITEIFKFPYVYEIEEAIEMIKKRINNIDHVKTTPTDRLFELLSEVQGVEIKPYDRFDIKDNCITYGPYYLDKNFKRYDATSNSAVNNEIILKGILTGEMKILKCKKAVVLTEDDIICLRYYLKNGYKYIANETTEDLEGKQQRLKLFKERPIYNKRNVTYKNVWEHYIDKINITKDTDWTIVKDELSFEHYDHPEIWDIEELLEQERVNND